MSVSPQDLIDCGGDLCRGTSEAQFRASMSRSYYGCYHAVRAWYAPLLPGSNTGPKGGVHQGFVNELRNPAPENAADVRQLSKMLAMQLDVARNHRRVADYELGHTIDQLQAVNMHALSVSITKRLSSSPLPGA